MKNRIKLLAIFAFLLFAVSCEKDNPAPLTKESNFVKKSIDLLSGETIVFSTVAKMGSTNKTLLEDGCPVRYSFQWLPEREKLRILLDKFSVGNMPLKVTMLAEVSFSELNKWERDGYTEEGWVKFTADDGALTASPKEGEEIPEPDGAVIIKGYVNPVTEEIEFFINFNMMTVTTHCFRQKIDKSRLKTYEEDFKKYEEDLVKYKKEHGIE